MKENICLANRCQKVEQLTKARPILYRRSPLKALVPTSTQTNLTPPPSQSIDRYTRKPHWVKRTLIYEVTEQNMSCLTHNQPVAAMFCEDCVSGGLCSQCISEWHQNHRINAFASYEEMKAYEQQAKFGKADEAIGRMQAFKNSYYCQKDEYIALFRSVGQIRNNLVSRLRQQIEVIDQIWQHSQKSFKAVLSNVQMGVEAQLTALLVKMQTQRDQIYAYADKLVLSLSEMGIQRGVINPEPITPPESKGLTPTESKGLETSQIQFSTVKYPSYSFNLAINNLRSLKKAFQTSLTIWDKTIIDPNQISSYSKYEGYFKTANVTVKGVSSLLKLVKGIGGEVQSPHQSQTD